MQPLHISAIVVAFIAAIIVWSIVFIEYRKIKRQKRIEKLIDRIIERTEDSGNESEGDKEELAMLVDFDPWVGDNL
uniref:Protein Vpu n=1 Tax=Human immunodeficiency virus type 1 TaxID=11676 RepID=A0A6M4F9L6_HV1|nr:vpu protein [Human immunodeficiency virus 1]